MQLPTPRKIGTHSEVQVPTPQKIGTHAEVQVPTPQKNAARTLDLGTYIGASRRTHAVVVGAGFWDLGGGGYTKHNIFKYNYIKHNYIKRCDIFIYRAPPPL